MTDRTTRDEIARIIAATDGWFPGDQDWQRDPPQGFYEAADALIAAFDVRLREPQDEFVQVGAWLLPAAYGNDYDHFTQTTAETKRGVCVALYAKPDDLVGTPAEYRLPPREPQAEETR